MNLLAHALLSPADPAILFGNLTADWVKGRARRTLPGAIQAGMLLHQRIDAYTDMHPVVDHCAELLAPRWGRYAPVLVDVLLDHVLSVEWRRYCTMPREQLIAEAYQSLRTWQHLLPERARFAVHAMLADDWLSCYISLDGIGLSLSRMSTRLNMRGHAVELAPAIHDFAARRSEFHAAFHEFFPQLRAHVENAPLQRVDLPA